MRINLQCPFQDKDLAKQRGARWDPKLRVWYVQDAADLGPFAAWLPQGEARPVAERQAAGATAAPPPGRGPARSDAHGMVATGPATSAWDCGCDALPWVACDCAPPA